MKSNQKLGEDGSIVTHIACASAQPVSIAESSDVSGDLRLPAQVLLKKIIPAVVEYADRHSPGITQVGVLASLADDQDLQPRAPWQVAVAQLHARSNHEQLAVILEGIKYTIIAIVCLKLGELKDGDAQMLSEVGKLRAALKADEIPGESLASPDVAFFLAQEIIHVVSIWWGILSLVTEKAGKGTDKQQIVVHMTASMPLVGELASMQASDLDALIKDEDRLLRNVLVFNPKCFVFKDGALVLDRASLNKPTDLPATGTSTHHPIYTEELFRPLMAWQAGIAGSFYLPARLHREGEGRQHPAEVPEDVALWRLVVRKLLKKWPV